jgi:hypothetical protein
MNELTVDKLKYGDKFHLFNYETGEFGKLVYIHLDDFYECESCAEDEDGNPVRVGCEDIVQRIE